jgi:putative endonuclease
MCYVYILESEDGRHFYVGFTMDLQLRVKQRNAGRVAHTSKHLPWRLKTYIAFANAEQAHAFERHLTSASGRAFARKRL